MLSRADFEAERARYDTGKIGRAIVFLTENGARGLVAFIPDGSFIHNGRNPATPYHVPHANWTSPDHPDAIIVSLDDCLHLSAGSLLMRDHIDAAIDQRYRRSVERLHRRIDADKRDAAEAERRERELIEAAANAYRQAPAADAVAAANDQLAHLDRVDQARVARRVVAHLWSDRPLQRMPDDGWHPHEYLHQATEWYGAPTDPTEEAGGR